MYIPSRTIDFYAVNYLLFYHKGQIINSKLVYFPAAKTALDKFSLQWAIALIKILREHINVLCGSSRMVPVEMVDTIHWSTATICHRT